MIEKTRTSAVCSRFILKSIKRKKSPIERHVTLMIENHSKDTGTVDDSNTFPLKEDNNGESGSNEDDSDRSIASSSQKPTKRYLAAFDFDHTIVEQNTDTVCRDMLLEGKKSALRQQLASIAASEGWTEHMARVFLELHKRQIGPNRLLNRIQQLPEVKGMSKLLRKLHDNYKCDLIIISDSNSVFIDAWLNAYRLIDPPLFRQIFTNPAHFDEEGLLHISPFHNQVDCKLSARNLCKGKVLCEFINEQNSAKNPYSRVFYIGDGHNDLCPVLRLRSQDIACARQGYALAATLTDCKSKRKPDARLEPICQKPAAQVLFWSDGYDLLHQLEKYLHSDSNEDR